MKSWPIVAAQFKVKDLVDNMQNKAPSLTFSPTPTNKEKKFSKKYCLPDCLWIFKVYEVKREHKRAYQLWENREGMYYLFKRSRTKRPNSTKA